MHSLSTYNSIYLVGTEETRKIQGWHNMHFQVHVYSRALLNIYKVNDTNSSLINVNDYWFANIIWLKEVVGSWGFTTWQFLAGLLCILR